MASLYQISKDILDIFVEIENQEEVTDNQYELLCIKEEELKTKLDSYIKAIKSFEADEKALKDEKKRFNDRQTILKNRIDRLKKAALNAVLEFGQQGKSNMYIELPTFRLYSRTTNYVEIDEDRINIFIEEFERYVRELVDAGILYAGKDVDLQGILDCINANIRADYGEDFEPFTINDLIAIKINVSQTASVYDLFKSGLALNLYGKEPINTKMENVTTKDDWKTIIECANTTNISQPTMAKIVKNQSLQIK